MTDRMYDEISLEREIAQYFGIDVDISKPIIYRVPAGRMVEATLFLTDKKQLYLYIKAQSKMIFDDIRKIVNRMGLKADIYLPPHGRPNYFNEIGKSKFLEVFPGRKSVSEDDIRYYKGLVPYNPALVLISEVRDGCVYQFDSDSTTNWRVGAKFTYRRIKTSY